MKIQYIQHSCFLIEFEKVIFVFDYYKGKLYFPEGKTIYFFVSHKHSDHFTMKIFKLAKEIPNIHFVLANDMKMTKKYLDCKEVCQEARDKIIYAKKNEKLPLEDGIMVRTLTSTDEGVAYLIKYKESTEKQPYVIYHAGDLNWWSWEGASNQEEKTMEACFKHEIHKLKDETIDVAFLPLDPRLEERFYLGFDYFANEVKAKYLVPMHLWEHYDTVQKLKDMEISKEYRDKIMDVTECQQWLDIGE